jgi:hypothetical protein
MLFPLVKTEEWIDKYPDLEIDHDYCPICNRKLSTTKPFITKELVGLMAPRCKCSYHSNFCIFIERNKEKTQTIVNNLLG